VDEQSGKTAFDLDVEVSELEALLDGDK